MPIDDLKLRAFKEAAVAQGFSPQAVDSFIGAKRRAVETEEAQIDEYAGAVASGYPITNISDPAMQMKVFNKLRQQTTQPSVPTPQAPAAPQVKTQPDFGRLIAGGVPELPSEPTTLPTQPTGLGLPSQPTDLSYLFESPTERKEKKQAQLEAQNYVDLMNTGEVSREEYMDLSENAKALLREAGYTPPKKSAEDLTSDERKAGLKIQSLERDVNLLEETFGAISGRGPLTGGIIRGLSEKTGGLVEADAASFEALRSALIAPVARVLSGESGMLNEGDIQRAEGMLPKITDSPSLVERKMSNIRALIQGQKADLGIVEEEAVPTIQPADQLKGIEGVPTEKAAEPLLTSPVVAKEPGLPSISEAPLTGAAENIARVYGKAGELGIKITEKAAGIVDKVADFFFPETTQLVKDTASEISNYLKTGEIPEKPDEYILGIPPAAGKTIETLVPGGYAFRKDQVGRAAREIGTAVAINYAMGWLCNKFLKPVWNKVTGPVKKAWRSFIGADPATQSFASAFTIPTKRAAGLKPIETSRKMVEYGIHGNLDDLAGVSAKVTGANGTVSKFTREVLAKSKGEVVLDDVLRSASNMIDESIEITPKMKNQILRQIANKTPTGQMIMQANPLDAFDMAKKLQSKAMQHYLVGHNYLSPKLLHQEVAKVYFAAADEILLGIEKSLGKTPTLIQSLKTPELMAGLKLIGNGTFADDFARASSFGSLRSLQAPFVRLGQMVELTQHAAQSAAMKVSSGAGTRLATTIGGWHLGNIPGAVIGFLAAPFVETATQTSRAPIMTGAAQLVKKAAETGLPAIPPALEKAAGKTLETGLKVGGQALRGLITKQLKEEREYKEKKKGGGGFQARKWPRPWQYK